jgi:excisionase family DNA binding protein
VERSSPPRLAYSVHELGELFGLSETAVRHLIDRHALPARRLGQRRIVVLATDLEQYLATLPRVDRDAVVPA